jgi:hypothetical protein
VTSAFLAIVESGLTANDNIELVIAQKCRHLLEIGNIGKRLNLFPKTRYPQMMVHLARDFEVHVRIRNAIRQADRMAALNLTFADKLQYCKENEFRTAETTLPFKVLGQAQTAEPDLVDLKGENPNRLIDFFVELERWEHVLSCL